LTVRYYSNSSSKLSAHEMGWYYKLDSTLLL